MRRLAILAVVAAGLGHASAAYAVQTQVVTDCNTHGALTQQYTAGQLRNALATLPADVKEYTDCYDVIQRALLAQLGSSGRGGGPGTGGGSGGSFLPTPLIIVLVLLALGGAGFGVLAARRR
jgi:hypothetical protein